MSASQDDAHGTTTPIAAPVSANAAVRRHHATVDNTTARRLDVIDVDQVIARVPAHNTPLNANDDSLAYFDAGEVDCDVEDTADEDTDPAMATDRSRWEAHEVMQLAWIRHDYDVQYRGQTRLQGQNRDVMLFEKLRERHPEFRHNLAAVKAKVLRMEAQYRRPCNLHCRCPLATHRRITATPSHRRHAATSPPRRLASKPPHLSDIAPASSASDRRPIAPAASPPPLDACRITASREMPMLPMSPLSFPSAFLRSVSQVLLSPTLPPSLPSVLHYLPYPPLPLSPRLLFPFPPNHTSLFPSQSTFSLPHNALPLPSLCFISPPTPYIPFDSLPSPSLLLSSMQFPSPLLASLPLPTFVLPALSFPSPPFPSLLLSYLHFPSPLSSSFPLFPPLSSSSPPCPPLFPLSFSLPPVLPFFFHVMVSLSPPCHPPFPSLISSSCSVLPFLPISHPFIPILILRYVQGVTVP
ncbi:unnamed protein product [Closterium sp. NIES-53]